VTTVTRGTRGAITTERLIVVAEQLYADHGLDAVSLRQIAEAAGQKNHAVVQYHFGTKEELLKAIVRYRTGDAQDRRRAALDALEGSGRQHDVRGLLEAAVVPLVTSQPPDSHYLRFIVALQPVVLNDIWIEIGEEHGASSNRITKYLDQALEHIPAPMRQARIGRAFDMMLRALAEHFDPAAAATTRPIPDDLFLDELVLSGAAVLEAPLPPRAAQRLRAKTR
jgi:AcrR family transcriptional regulator